jgi:hypothetical protein
MAGGPYCKANSQICLPKGPGTCTAYYAGDKKYFSSCPKGTGFGARADSYLFKGTVIIPIVKKKVPKVRVVVAIAIAIIAIYYYHKKSEGNKIE